MWYNFFNSHYVILPLPFFRKERKEEANMPVGSSILVLIDKMLRCNRLLSRILQLLPQ
jgi:hypothetical protein